MIAAMIMIMIMRIMLVGKMRQTKRAKLRGNPLHKFLFLRPRENVNAEALAEKLLSLKNVQEVILTEGDCGYIVKTRFLSDKSDKEAEEYIKKNMDGVFGTAMSYAHFRKQAHGAGVVA